MLISFTGGGLDYFAVMGAGQRTGSFRHCHTGTQSNDCCFATDTEFSHSQRSHGMKLRRRKFLKAGAGSAALLAATGCNQLPRELHSVFGLDKPANDPFLAPVAESIDPIIHVLNRAAFGARPGEHAKICTLAKSPEDAAAAWLERQLQPETIMDEDADYAVRRFETLNEPLGELFEYQPELLHNELMRATLVRAVSSERQMFEMMVQFWSDHFNISPT